MYTRTMTTLAVLLMAIVCCSASASADERSADNDKNILAASATNDEAVKAPAKKYFNYLRLPDGECHNCSTYKCTNLKTNLGGSEWCIMLFPAAIAHCDSDPTCGGYTMTTGDWFHKKHDKNGQTAVHLYKAGEKSTPCPLAEWSSYDKQKDTRSTPIIYGKTTCEPSNRDSCDLARNFNYVFESNSNAGGTASPYLCDDHPNSLDKKNHHCILPIGDGVTVCNADDKCEGFMINTDAAWQKNFTKNGMQAVQLFGQGATYTPSQMWRSFKKQQ